jgi:hypothetical protein
MILPPRTLAIRLVLWTALLVYAIWNLRGRSAEEVFAEAPPAAAPLRVPLPAPAARVAPIPLEVPAIVDVAAAVAAMDAATASVGACGARGTFGVRLGASGLAEGWLMPEGPQSEAAPRSPSVADCASKAAWAPAWPATTQGFEMERPVGAR